MWWEIYYKKEGFKGKELTICKRFRKLFRNHKYEVYLINEFKTSKICNECEKGECETFLERELYMPKSVCKIMKCWGVEIYTYFWAVVMAAK